MNWLHWAVLSAVFAAATALLAKVGVAGIDSHLATAIRTSVVVVFTWTIAFGASAGRPDFHFGRKPLLFLVLSGIATGLSWLCYFRALQLGEASKVAAVDKLSVALVILLAALFLSESFTTPKLIGGALIVAGVVVLSLW